MIQRYAHEKHGQTPTQWAKHSLVAVFVGVRTQERNDRRVGQRDSGGAEKFSYHDQKKQQEKNLFDILEKKNTRFVKSFCTVK